MVTKLNFDNKLFFLSKSASIAPLVIFRVIFGLMMCGSAIRFWSKGWIHSFFLQPQNFFHYYGFSWVKPFGEIGMYVVFFLIIVSSFFLAIGFLYRLSSILYFLLFTYVELIDATYYLNHYYFISLIAFIMCFLPANRRFSIDVWFKPKLKSFFVPQWTIWIIKFQLAVVYFYAGIAKINYDWLFDAMPMSIWLQAESHWPIVGYFFTQKWVAYLASWLSCLFDLTIVFFLVSNIFRIPSYIILVIFHVLTAIMFPIGMFPWIMILSTLIFFPAKFHEKILQSLQSLIKIKSESNRGNNIYIQSRFSSRFFLFFFGFYVFFQVLFPFRYLLYPGDLFWTEQGYRFSWRVMLMEKAGTAFFYVTDPETGQRGEVDNNQFLTLTQEKMMATQPDFILQYAQIIKREVQSRGLKNPIINAEVYVTLNGSRSKMLFDPLINLLDIKDGFCNKAWLSER